MKPAGKRRAKLRKWLGSYEDVSSWIERKVPQGLERLLEESGGFVKIPDFLPAHVADGILEVLEGIPDGSWNVTEADYNPEHNNIDHKFLSVKSCPSRAPELESVFRVLTLLMPDSLFTFSAAKYGTSGFIVPHDDRAYTQVRMEDGSVQLCSRVVACILHLTKGWKPEWGGELVDLGAPGGAPRVHVPQFNSLVAFAIPRWHEVRLVTGDRPRYSVFGWFLEPGMLYELNTGQQQQQEDEEWGEQEDDREEEEEERERQQQQRLEGKKRRMKKKKRADSSLQQQAGVQDEEQLQIQRPEALAQAQPSSTRKRAKRQLQGGGGPAPLQAQQQQRHEHPPQEEQHQKKKKKKKKKRRVEGGQQQQQQQGQ